METINLRRLTEWGVIEPGEYLSLPGGPRDVVIAFSTATPTPIFIKHGDRTFPLGMVSGTVEYRFRVEGDVEITPTSEDNIAFRTQDGQITALQWPADTYETWASDMEPVTRNLQEEWVQFQSMQNAQRRADQLSKAAEADRQRAQALLGEATELLKNAKGGDKPPTGGDDTAGAGKKPESKPVDDKPAKKDDGKDDKSGA